MLAGALLLTLGLCATALDTSLGAIHEHLLALAKERPEHAFGAWAVHHNKKYDCDEHKAKAFETFQTNVDFIHEQLERQPGIQMALNEFADMTWEEFSVTKLGLKPELKEG
eukprot:gene573-1991_t